MDRAIVPLAYGHRIAGWARTARAAPGDNSAVHRAVHSATAGDIVVVATDRDESTALFGDILAQACCQKGVTGVVIDGLARDRAELVSMGFPMWCRGCKPSRPAKIDRGSIDVEIQCGGTTVRPGDLIVADDDGVVVLSGHASLEVVIAALRDNEAAEAAIRGRIAKGESSCTIFNIEP